MVKKTYSLLKYDGRMYLNIPLDKNKGGIKSVYADVVNIAKGIGYGYQSTIVWNEQNISRRTALAIGSYLMDKGKILSLIQRKKLNTNELSKLIEEEKENYIKLKIKEYMSQGFTKEQAINKANPSWRTYIGNHLQDLIIEILKVYIKDKNIKIIKDSNLKGKKLTKELDLVKRMLLIHFDNYSFLPDADIILYKTLKNTVQIICIISVKNSFRERGFETTYWKLKLKENINTKHIKVFLATPDEDDEISTIKHLKALRK